MFREDISLPEAIRLVILRTLSLSRPSLAAPLSQALAREEKTES